MEKPIFKALRHFSPTEQVLRSEWRVLSTERTVARNHKCEACKIPIQNVVRLQCVARPKVLLFIGTECLKSLNENLKDTPDWNRERVGVNRPLTRAELSANLKVTRKAVKDRYTEREFVEYETWGGFLIRRYRQAAHELPPDVRQGVRQLDEEGLISDPRWLDACCDYFNANAPFQARVVLGPQYVKYGLQSTDHITIAQGLALLAAPPAAPSPEETPSPKLPAAKSPAQMPPRAPSPKLNARRARNAKLLEEQELHARTYLRALMRRKSGFLPMVVAEEVLAVGGVRAWFQQHQAVEQAVATEALAHRTSLEKLEPAFDSLIQRYRRPDGAAFPRMASLPPGTSTAAGAPTRDAETQRPPGTTARTEGATTPRHQ